MTKAKAKPRAKSKAKAGTSKSTAKDRRKQFPAAYIAAKGNATEAAKTVGFSPKGAAVAGSRMLREANVAAEIERLRAKALKDAEDKGLLTAQEVLESLARGLRFDPRKLYREDGSLKPITELDDSVALELEGVEIDEITLGKGKDAAVIGHTSKVKFPRKHVVREQAMKHFGLFEKDNRQKIEPVADLLEAIHERGSRPPVKAD